MKKIIVNENFNNKKLSSFFMSSFSDVSISSFYKLLRKKDIRINGRRIHENIVIHTGDEVQVFLPDKSGEKYFSIVYEDDNILVVNKPVGTTVTNEENSLENQLKRGYTFIEPCHRLDRNTSGLVLFAKNSQTLEILLDKFKSHEIEKQYVCIVLGRMPKKEDTLNSFLFKDAKKSTVYVSDNPKKGYLSIITSYKVLNYNKEKDLSILNVHLHTGRTHQIRAHLAHIGHPILGDGKYGINEINKRFKMKTQALCAYSLKFNFKKCCKLDYLKSKEIKIDFPDYFNLI